MNEAAQRRLQRRLQLCSQVEDCFVTNELTKLGSQSDNFSRRLTGGKQHMACTIKRDALIQQHAALRCNPSFAPRPRKPRQHLLVYAALSVDSPSLSCASSPQLPTPGLASERPQEYWQIVRPFHRLTRLPSAPLEEMITPPIASPTNSKDPARLTTSTSKLMRYYGPHLLSLTVSTLDIGQLERKMVLIAKRALGAWKLCVSGTSERERVRASERKRAHTCAREKVREREQK